MNYVPVAESTPMSAQFSAPVSISGGASLTVHTLHVDPATTFTAGNASLTFDTLTLKRGATPARLVVNGDVTITGLSGATAKIGTNAGASNTGLVDLSGGTRAFNVANGAAATDLDDLGPGRQRRPDEDRRGNDGSSAAASTYTGPTTVSQGKLMDRRIDRELAGERERRGVTGRHGINRRDRGRGGREHRRDARDLGPDGWRAGDAPADQRQRLGLPC